MTPSPTEADVKRVRDWLRSRDRLFVDPHAQSVYNAMDSVVAGMWTELQTLRHQHATKDTQS